MKLRISDQDTTQHEILPLSEGLLRIEPNLRAIADPQTVPMDAIQGRALANFEGDAPGIWVLEEPLPNNYLKHFPLEGGAQHESLNVATVQEGVEAIVAKCMSIANRIGAQARLVCHIPSTKPETLGESSQAVCDGLKMRAVDQVVRERIIRVLAPNGVISRHVRSVVLRDQFENNPEIIAFVERLKARIWKRLMEQEFAFEMQTVKNGAQIPTKWSEEMKLFQMALSMPTASPFQAVNEPVIKDLVDALAWSIFRPSMLVVSGPSTFGKSLLLRRLGAIFISELNARIIRKSRPAISLDVFSQGDMDELIKSFDYGAHNIRGDWWGDSDEFKVTIIDDFDHVNPPSKYSTDPSSSLTSLCFRRYFSKKTDKPIAPIHRNKPFGQEHATALKELAKTFHLFRNTGSFVILGSTNRVGLLSSQQEDLPCLREFSLSGHSYNERGVDDLFGI